MKTSYKSLSLFVIGFTMLGILAGCASPSKVMRVDPNQPVDLSGKWNDTDSKKVSDEIIPACLNDSWSNKFMEYSGRLPVVMVATVYNKTDEHISADTFISDLERAMIESKRVRVVQGGAELDEIRAIRQGQTSYTDPAVRDYLQKELGVDYVVQGAINKISDIDANRRVYYYQVDLELIDLKTTEKVWIGQQKLKKYVEKGYYTF
ncbi:hypothetical protein U14_02774 [Candidatus Moduliflexus flocculans]|uniref:Penicillin-binding protein activator LpoB n=1 Tax=Candidatus Moduliflexus flocculans TaxID=1499966 RepID=A0A081BMB3_9BACT|nr:hypothetical protein U14_02774 [Candidatus Moduliflexus flocculans]